MKKYLILIISLIPLNLYSQSLNENTDEEKAGITIARSENSTEIGIKAGIIFSQTLIKNLEVAEPELPLLKFSGGLSFHQLILPQWFLSADLLYEPKGFKREFYFTNNQGETEGDALDIQLVLNYLTLPVLLNFQTTGNVKIYAGAGFYAAYLLQAYTKEPLFEIFWHIPPWEWEIIGYQKRIFTETFNRFDFGATAQAGLKSPLTENIIIDFQIRFAHGLVSTTTEENNFGDVKYINRSLGMALNFQYRF